MHAAIPAPNDHHTSPAEANTTNAPRFVPALTNFAIADPCTKSAPTTAVNVNTKNVPVPGPIKPSYKAITPPANATATTTRTRVRRPGSATTPNRGRNVTNNATATNTANTTGRYAAAGTTPANAAPTPAVTTANPAAGPANRQSIFVRRAYVTAAVAVPAIAANLFVPNATGNGNPGAAINNAGNNNNPPPPTTASTHPAAPAATNKPTNPPRSTTRHYPAATTTPEQPCGQPHPPPINDPAADAAQSPTPPTGQRPTPNRATP